MDIGIIFLFIGTSLPHSVNSDWLFSTLSRVLQANWFTLEINEKVTLNINMPYWKCLSNRGKAVKIIINELYVLLKPCCGLTHPGIAQENATKRKAIYIKGSQREGFQPFVLETTLRAANYW